MFLRLCVFVSYFALLYFFFGLRTGWWNNVNLLLNIKRLSSWSFCDVLWCDDVMSCDSIINFCDCDTNHDITYSTWFSKYLLVTRLRRRRLLCSVIRHHSFHIIIQYVLRISSFPFRVTILLPHGESISFLDQRTVFDWYLWHSQHCEFSTIAN